MREFTNHNVPGCVGGDCFTVFYDGTVNTRLIRCDGTIAPVIEWNLADEVPRFKDDNDLTIVKVTAAVTEGNMGKLYYAVTNARHLNIRLILPKMRYPLGISICIDEP